MHPNTKAMILDAIRHSADFIYNLLYFTEHSPSASELAYIRNCVLSLPDKERDKYAEECEFVAGLPLDELNRIFIPYPSRSIVTPADIVAGTYCGLPFVEHFHKGRLFFPKRMTLNDAKKMYIGLMNDENIIGNGGTPHCYQDKSHYVENNDIILDIGCAEALFALDNVYKARKVYLFESLQEWRKPLALTFSRYADKIVFVNKFVSNMTTRKTTTILDAVSPQDCLNSHFFVKMDIEGWERTVLSGNADFFKNNKVKLSCCVYHRQDDARVITAMLKDMGYSTRYSEGFVLPAMNGVHFPFFRHGVVYAQNYS